MSLTVLWAGFSVFDIPFIKITEDGFHYLSKGDTCNLTFCVINYIIKVSF